MMGIIVPLAAFALLSLGGIAQANVFDLGPGLTNLETVTVGDAGNAADTRPYCGYGSVAYNYNISKYEVTAAQYCDFLNHKANVSDPYGLYNSSMWSDSYGCKIRRGGSAGNYVYSVASDYANRPVNWVSFWDSCRFANWLGNGQGNGDTEAGTYALNGCNDNDGRNVQRNVTWAWAVTSEDEWYKAAYYKANGLNAGYWYYPTQSNSINTGMANYNDLLDHTTNVGAYPDPSAYGTYDQDGNVTEWNEAIIPTNGNYARGVRGGSFYDIYGAHRADNRFQIYPTYECGALGFRLSEAPVSEPSSIIALLAGLAGVSGTIRRRA